MTRLAPISATLCLSLGRFLSRYRGRYLGLSCLWVSCLWVSCLCVSGAAAAGQSAPVPAVPAPEGEPSPERARPAEPDRAALTALRDRAESGDMAAQVALGSRLMESLDDATAAEGVAWLEKAALKGAPVYYVLGDAYARGVGVARDMRAAARWYRLGAEMGDGLAQFAIAKLYLTGTGVDTDIVRAVLYLKLANNRVYDRDRRREIADLLQRARWWTSWEEWKRVEELLSQWKPKTLQDLLN